MDSYSEYTAGTEADFNWVTMTKRRNLPGPLLRSIPAVGLALGAVIAHGVDLSAMAGVFSGAALGFIVYQLAANKFCA